MVFYTPEEPFPSQGSKKTDLVVKASERLWGTLGGTLGRLGGSKGEMQGHKKRGPMERNRIFNEFQKILSFLKNECNPGGAVSLSALHENWPRDKH